MRTYRRVTYEERCQIDAWLQVNLSRAEIARRLGFHKSTICREIKRNIGRYTYSGKGAHRKAEERYRCCRKPYKLNPEYKNSIDEKLKDGWSPEQIAGRFRLEGFLDVSHECIYQYVRQNKKRLVGYMRRMGKRGAGRYIQKNSPKHDNLPSIVDRPKEVETRKKIGHWERDNMLTVNRKPLLVCVERKTRFTKLGKPESSKAESMNKLTLELVLSTGKPAHSMTNDRGREFAIPLKVIKTYYCNPRCPQERGTVENTIGLIRQYITNQTKLETLDDNDISMIEDLINFRPRKSLDYRTPYEAMFNETVALAF